MQHPLRSKVCAPERAHVILKIISSVAADPRSTLFSCQVDFCALTSSRAKNTTETEVKGVTGVNVKQRGSFETYFSRLWSFRTSPSGTKELCSTHLDQVLRGLDQHGGHTP